ncbi:fimbrial protein (plasmid) [Serratia ureilytica]|uniref:fimbrial protein n=1 Tax=Serratia ureilytica TaxID=300181 RepID=UPI001CBB42C2|nr:fimbrial protein [Serratia ureilytica]UAN29735.1 fimbrial protein [Serratia ureilytica]
MKKILLTTAALSLSLAASSYAADGNVNFIGSITDQTCEVTTGSQNLNVVLGNVARTAFTGGTGTEASKTRFTLQLENCPAAALTARVKFDGTPEVTNPDYLAITSGAGVASGVAIKLYDASNTALPLNTASMSYPLVTTGVNNLNFAASYISTGPVTVGPANSTTAFTVNYN